MRFTVLCLSLRNLDSSYDHWFPIIRMTCGALKKIKIQGLWRFWFCGSGVRLKNLYFKKAFQMLEISGLSNLLRSTDLCKNNVWHIWKVRWPGKCLYIVFFTLKKLIPILLLFWQKRFYLLFNDFYVPMVKNRPLGKSTQHLRCDFFPTCYVLIFRYVEREALSSL